MAERNDSPGTKTEERRESPRVPMRFLVRLTGSESEFKPYQGDLSLGGCAFRGGTLEPKAQVEVRFILPSGKDELLVRGEVLPGSESGATRVRFLDLPVEAELAIARHLDDLELAPKP